jgi:hypothetical protein
MSIPLWEDDDSFWALPQGQDETPSGYSDLKCRFEVGQGARNLKAKFTVAQWAEDLKCRVVISLPGASDLKGKALIVVPDAADLKARTEIRHTAYVQLKARFEVGQGAVDLRARARISIATASVLSRSPVQDGATNAVLFYGATWCAQSFIAVADKIYGVYLKLYKAGTPPNDVTVSIRAVDGGGKPTGADLVSTTLAASRVTGSSKGFGIYFTTPYTLSIGTTYAVVIRTTGGDTSNRYGIYYTTGNPYAGGSYQTSSDSGSTWTITSSNDFTFGIYVLGGLKGKFFVGYDGDRDLKAVFTVRQTSEIEEANPSANNGSVWAITDTAYIAQVFKARSSRPLAAVTLHLYKIGSPAGSLIVSLRAVDGLGRPTGANLVSTTVAASSIPTSSTNQQRVSLPYPLVTGTKYAIVCGSPSSVSPNYYAWYSMYQSVLNYPDGDLVYSGTSGASWSVQTGQDTQFQENPTTDLKGVATVRQSSYRNLKAKFAVRHSSERDLKGRFFRGGYSSRDLKEILTVQHSSSKNLKARVFIINLGDADLKGKVFVGLQASQNLKAKFSTIKATSRQLKCKFFVAQGTRDLKGKFSLRRNESSDLKGKFIVTRSLSSNLKGVATIRGASTADVYGEFIVIHPYYPASQSLKAKFLIPSNLKAIFYVRHLVTTTSASLKAKMIIQQSSSRDLHGKFFIRQASADLKAVAYISTPAVDLKGVANVRNASYRQLRCHFYVNALSSAENLKGKVTIINKSASDLKAKLFIPIASSADLAGSFWVNKSYTTIATDLKAVFDVRQPSNGSADVKAKTAIRHSDSADLLSKFTVQKSSSYAELKCLASIRQESSTDLHATFYIPKLYFSANVDLKAKCVVNYTPTYNAFSDLKARFFIKASGSSDLLGKFTVPHLYSNDSADLKAICSINNVATYNGSSDLKAKFYIRIADSKDLLGKFIVQRLGGSADLKVVFSVRSETYRDLLGWFNVNTRHGAQNLKAKVEIISHRDLLGVFTVRNTSVNYDLTDDAYGWVNYWLKYGTGFMAAPARDDEAGNLSITIAREVDSAERLEFGWNMHPYEDLSTSRSRDLKCVFEVRP